MRANRIGTVTGELRFLSETNLERIEAVTDQEKPQIVVIDSIQTMYREEITSAPGSVSQVRESTGILNADRKKPGNCHLRSRSCDKRGSSGRSKGVGTYGRYSPLF